MASAMTDVLILLISLVVILFAAELFTNCLDWRGRKLGLGEGAVGSVLAGASAARPHPRSELITHTAVARSMSATVSTRSRMVPDAI